MCNRPVKRDAAWLVVGALVAALAGCGGSTPGADSGTMGAAGAGAAGSGPGGGSGAGGVPAGGASGAMAGGGGSGTSGSAGTAGGTGGGGTGGGGTCTRNAANDAQCTMATLSHFFLCTGTLVPARCSLLYAGNAVAAYCCP